MTKASFDMWMIGLLYILAPKWIYGTSKDFNSIIDYAAFTCAIIVIGVGLFYIMKNASIEGYRYLVVDSNRGRPLSGYTMAICYGLGVLIIIYSGDYLFMLYTILVVLFTSKPE
jgi:hypothetical protein